MKKELESEVKQKKSLWKMLFPQGGYIVLLQWKTVQLHVSSLTIIKWVGLKKWPSPIGSVETIR